MIIHCKKCSTSFNLDEGLLKPTGSKVRCSKCDEIFVAYPPTPPVEPDMPAEAPLDLDLGVEPEVDTAAEDIELDAQPDEPDELDLSEIEEMLDDAEAPAVEDKADEDLELDLDFDLEPEPEKAAEDAELDAAADEPDELDLSEIEEMLDDAEAPAVEDAADEAVEDQDLDLDFDFDLEPEPEKAAEDAELDAAADEPDELDLSEIEEMLDDAEAPAVEDAADEAVEELDLDLDLDFDLEPEPEKAVEDVAPEASPDESDEIDLSEIEKMLDEVEGSDVEDDAEIEEVDLALDMELEPELETAPEGVEAGVESEEVEEADLSELEKMLEVKEEDDLEFELDFDEKPAGAEVSVDESGVEILEFDGLDDVEDAIEADELTETLEFEPDVADQEEIEVDEDTADPFYVETQVLDRAAIEQPEPDVAVKEEKPKPPKPVRKKRISKPILILLILVLLAGVSYGVYTVLTFMNIEIPFVSDFLKPEAQDPEGKLKLHTFDINSKFVDNTKAGKLFVITGNVRNDYSGVRNFIRVKGTLFTTGKTVAKTETVFSGNVMSDIELSKLDLAAIKKRLLNRVGDNGSNIQVAPGKVLPFMIVFTGFPDNLEEFTVEAAGSTS